MLRWSVLVLAACHHHRPWPPPPLASPTPIAIPGINSPYDDFNSADMSQLMRAGLVFSTNRGSQGHDFDLYETRLDWERAETSGGRTPTPVTASPPTPFAPALMSNADERGPILITEWDHAAQHPWFAFASNRPGGLGGLDLYATACDPRAPNCTAQLLTGLSSPADDAYLTREFAERSVLFASNRAGGGNAIYEAAWAAGTQLDDPPARIARVDALSSGGDDTAPFVYPFHDRTEVVFVSTRPGGLGEHDIWCARFERGAWQAPVALGPAINSARDEYRPIVLDVNGTTFLVFSSTRDGGQGGYDLYVVGYAGCPS